MSNYYIGVDVGTGSARAGVFTCDGKMLASAVKNIKMWKKDPAFVEQSSNDIWNSVCHVVNKSVTDAGINKSDVKGIGFDATCSLVALDENSNPVTVSPSGDTERNVIVWMDHRAIEETEFINSTNHKVLEYVGGKISPEMETTKLLWLKKHMPKTWKETEKFYDLPDFLIYQATGKDIRSLCSTVCKWTYMGHEKGSSQNTVGRWSDSYFQTIGLEDLAENNYKKIGSVVKPIGESISGGLCEKSAEQLGLSAGTAVGVSMIDAHAGGIGMIGAQLEKKPLTNSEMSKRLALIGGTSSCHMAVSTDPNFVPGVWGPYYSAMLPEMWLAEGGQSATGALVDHVIFTNSRADELKKQSDETNKSVYEILNNRLEKLAAGKSFPAELTKELHVLPYFHGNRSPRANPFLKGMISGLKLSDSIDELALLYLATIQSIAYGTKHIIEEMNKNGFQIETIFACGGGTKNPVFLREHADITGCEIVLSKEKEAVLLGSAILGAVASGNVPSVLDGMKAMNKVDRVIKPNSGKVADYHNVKYKVFHKMYKDQLEYSNIMNYK
ncbi:MAG TPA: FGGY-family carbohydrate kinase [Victivallales bacterium]|nr:FGGY-family carbohydrate kinase [Victivallales bacterium]